MEEDLISRLEKASLSDCVSDRSLDGRIWCALNGLHFVVWDGAGCVFKQRVGHDGIRHQAADRIANYTTSLESAMQLTANALPGWRRSLEELRPDRWWAGLKPPEDDSAGYAGNRAGFASTAPLALLVALLSAKEITA